MHRTLKIFSKWFDQHLHANKTHTDTLQIDIIWFGCLFFFSRSMIFVSEIRVGLMYWLWIVYESINSLWVKTNCSDIFHYRTDCTVLTIPQAVFLKNFKIAWRILTCDRSTISICTAQHQIWFVTSCLCQTSMRLTDCSYITLKIMVLQQNII